MLRNAPPATVRSGLDDKKLQVVRTAGQTLRKMRTLPLRLVLLVAAGCGLAAAYHDMMGPPNGCPSREMLQNIEMKLRKKKCELLQVPHLETDSVSEKESGYFHFSNRDFVTSSAACVFFSRGSATKNCQCVCVCVCVCVCFRNAQTKSWQGISATNVLQSLVFPPQFARKEAKSCVPR